MLLQCLLVPVHHILKWTESDVDRNEMMGKEDHITREGSDADRNEMMGKEDHITREGSI